MSGCADCKWMSELLGRIKTGLDFFGLSLEDLIDPRKSEWFESVSITMQDKFDSQSNGGGGRKTREKQLCDALSELKRNFPKIFILRAKIEHDKEIAQREHEAKLAKQRADQAKSEARLKVRLIVSMLFQLFCKISWHSF